MGGIKMKHTEMNMEQLANATLTTGKLLESTTLDFMTYLDTLNVGGLLGVQNYLKAEFERVKQVKDHLLENPLVKKKNPDAMNTLEGLYAVLTVIETRHNAVATFLDFRRKGISTEPILANFRTQEG